MAFGKQRRSLASHLAPIPHFATKEVCAGSNFQSSSSVSFVARLLAIAQQKSPDEAKILFLPSDLQGIIFELSCRFSANFIEVVTFLNAGSNSHLGESARQS
jgi:hypothetical protein